MNARADIVAPHPLRAAGVLLACLAALLATAAPAAANPACGATITHNVKLKSDMDCSGSNTNGITVGKDGLTINLNGHKLIGPNSGFQTGVDDTGGYDHVTLKDGTVSGYYENVYFSYTSGSRIDHVRAVIGPATVGYGIDVEYSRNTPITHSTVSGHAIDAFYLYENNRVNLSHSKVVNADPVSEKGVYDYYSRSTLSDVTANGTDTGFYIDTPIRGYTIADSTANGGNTGFGIYDNYQPSGVYQATLSHNGAKNNMGYGFYADLQTLGKHNHARHNHPNCFHVTCSK